ncbi:MAG: bifunctional folylpolyglutamate synthase/dihydrofolate synthase [Halioglobus sp.]|nr:bifunctional folylpolyglutamate synthase/dihydrofolate synthase [Halioglobus sp.]
MNKASLTQWLQRLEVVHPKAVDLGLERVLTVAHSLQLLPVKTPVVTVAGTNGKGSVVAVLDALISEAGNRVGVFTSPHLLRFNERIRIAGVDASDAEIVDAFSVIDEARGPVSLTYFEFAALAALLIFDAKALDFVILEVGLGGRLDAVNIVDASVAVITSIALDHQDWLGNSRGEISREKAGIVRRGRPVVIADSDPPPELLACVADVAASPALYLGREFFASSVAGQWQGRLRTSDGTVRTLAATTNGSLLPENIAAALQAVLLLGIEFSDDCVANALAKLSAVGRRERRHVAGRAYVLDVAHNPASASKLLEFLDATPCNGKKICIFSAMADKDISGIIDATAGYFDAWFLGDQPDNIRAADAVDIAAMLDDTGQAMVSISKNLRQAFRRAQSVAGEGDSVVVFGSFCTVAAILPLLDKDRSKYEAL